MQKIKYIGYKYIHILLFGLIILAFLLSTTPRAYAAETQVESYELIKYDQQTEVLRSHQYNVTQKLTIKVPEGMSSVQIQLPNGNFVLSGVSLSGDLVVDDANYRIQTDSNGNRSVVLTLSGLESDAGRHTLTLSYVIQEYQEHNSSYDIFYYDAVSPNWSIPIRELRLEVELPDDFDMSNLQYYAGQYGNQDVNNLLDYSVDGTTITMKGSRLPENFGISFKAQIEDGYWEEALDNSWTLWAALILMVVTLVVLCLFWLAAGRDPKVHRTEEIHPIEGVSPADIGFLINGRTRIRDLGALLVYMAIKGYFRIVEVQPKKYQLVRLEEPKGEERYIRSVYNTLFEEVYHGRALDLSYPSYRLRTAFKMLSVNIENGYSSKDMRASKTSSKVFRYISIVMLSLTISTIYLLANMYEYQDPGIGAFLLIALLTVAALFGINWRFDNRYDTDVYTYRLSITGFTALYVGILLFIMYSLWQNTSNALISAAIIFLGVLSMVVTLFMKARTRGNAELVERILSLRSFMNNVTPSELARMQLANKEYYYEMLPYAIIFSMEETWARKFSWIGSVGSEFYEDLSAGTGQSMPESRKGTDIIARELKTFCRTLDNEYHVRNLRRRKK